MADTATDQTTNNTETRAARQAKRSADWRNIWRIHFYAGMIAMPVLAVLALSGLLILYTDAVEDFLVPELRKVDASDTDQTSLDDQAATVRATYPDQILVAVNPPWEADRSTEFIVEGDEALAVYVDPYSGEILGDRPVDASLVGWANTIHGNLFIGQTIPVPTPAGLFGEEPIMTELEVGDLLVELVACWTIVLIASGIYLWFPRKGGIGRGLFVPRLAKRGRARWRDIHALTGIYTGAILAFVLLTGLPWSGYWGGTFDWATAELQMGWNWPEDDPASTEVSLGDLDRFGTEVGWIQQDLPASATSQAGGAAPLSLDRVAEAATIEGATMRRTIWLPVDGEPHHEGGPSSSLGTYTVGNYWPQTVDTERTIYLDQFTGEKVGEFGADQYETLGWVASWGIDTHMGTQLGIVSRVLMTVVCLGLLASTGSAAVMFWRRRRRTGGFGAPNRPVDASLGRAATLVAIGLSILFPLVGMSFLAVAGVDRIVIRNIGPTRTAFGMTPKATQATSANEQQTP